MTNDTATIRETYALLEAFRKENNEQSKKLIDMFETFHKNEFQPLKESVDKFKAYAVVVIFFLSIIGSIIADWVKKNILHI